MIVTEAHVDRKAVGGPQSGGIAEADWSTDRALHRWEIKTRRYIAQHAEERL